MNFVAALARDGKRRSELPSVGNSQGRGVDHVVGLPSFGIEQNLVPADDGEFVGGGRTGRESAFERGRRKKIRDLVGEDFVHAGRNFDVDGQAVERVAAPFQRLSACPELAP